MQQVRASLQDFSHLTLLLVLLAFCTTTSLSPNVTRAEIKPEAALKQPMAAQALVLDVAKLDDQGALIAVGDLGHILRSSDSGKSWQQIASPVRSMLTGITVVDSHVWISGHDATILYSADKGESFSIQKFDPELEQPLFGIWFRDADNGFAYGAYGLLFTTTDGGTTWETKPVDEEEPHLFSLATTPQGTLYIAGEFGAAFRSKDQGQSWERLSTPYEGSYFGVLAPNDEVVLLFGLRGNVYRSTDGGDSWQAVETNTKASFLDGLSVDTQRLLLVGLSGTVIESRDLGLSFRSLEVSKSQDKQDDSKRLGISAALALTSESVLLAGEKGFRRLELAQ